MFVFTPITNFCLTRSLRPGKFLRRIIIFLSSRLYCISKCNFILLLLYHFWSISVDPLRVTGTSTDAIAIRIKYKMTSLDPLGCHAEAIVS